MVTWHIRMGYVIYPLPADTGSINVVGGHLVGNYCVYRLHYCSMALGYCTTLGHLDGIRTSF
jgi:hypothetical protein